MKRDTQYIIKAYFPGQAFHQKGLSLKIQRKIQGDILNILDFNIFDQDMKGKLGHLAQKKIRENPHPRYIFESLLEALDKNRSTLPGYSTLQKIIRKAFLREEKRLSLIISQNIPQYVDKKFRQLLDDDDSTYGITVFKTDAKGFKNTDIRAEIEKKYSSEALYNFAAKTLPKLKLSMDNILYYASLVDYYSLDKLRELSYDKARLYLVCYTFYRFQKTNDNLIHAFFHYMTAYQKKAKESGKQAVYEHKVSDSDYLEKAHDLISLFVDKKIRDKTLFKTVRKRAFGIVTEEDFPALKKGLEGNKIDEKKFVWNHYPKISGLITHNIRPLIRAINFEGSHSQQATLKALDFLRHAFDQGKSLKSFQQGDFPIDFLSNHKKPYLYDLDENTPEIKTINVHKYEFHLYEHLAQALSSGNIFVNNSKSFKSLEIDLMPRKQGRGKEVFLNDLNNSLLTTPLKKQLANYRKELNALWIEVNEEIKSGKNKEIKIHKTGKWTLPYTGKKPEINNPVYQQLPQISLLDILHFTNEKCDFLRTFTHMKHRYAKGGVEAKTIYACLIAFATNHGIFKISQISDLKYNTLHVVSKNNIRLENLKNAADIVSDKIAKLPMFKRWNFMDNLLFASLDGKKRQTKRQNIISRFSPKYFGRKRGVASYSMIANNVCVKTKILGANEHESHYVFDMFKNNNTAITADYICGDDHSINSINFALSALISHNFTPHLKNLYQKSQKIFCFGKMDPYKESLLKPVGQINSKLIEDEWDNLQHIFASLLMKETTQSIVVKKLSSYKHRHKTYVALMEFDKIFKSLHILRFIQDPVLRQCIRTALNRGEGIHQLTGALGNVGGGKFKGNTELELQVANESLRLVTNCILYYNTLILSALYDDQEKKGNIKALEFIKRLPPIAWCHINLSGQYDFTAQASPPNIDEIIANLDFDADLK